jgi:hypothetical protein
MFWSPILVGILIELKEGLITPSTLWLDGFSITYSEVPFFFYVSPQIFVNACILDQSFFVGGPL